SSPRGSTRAGYAWRRSACWRQSAWDCGGSPEPMTPPTEPTRGRGWAFPLSAVRWRASVLPSTKLSNCRRKVEPIGMSSESDRLLVQQIRQGDARAWNDLIARYEGRLLAFVDRRLHDRAASEDVVQETFVGFVNSLPNFDERRELQTYLFT